MLSASDPAQSTDGAPAFSVAVHPDRTRVVVAPAGELDLTTAPRLERRLVELGAAGLGTAMRETRLRDRTVGELLGPADVLDARADDDGASLPWRTAYVARAPVTLAVLDDRFLVAARRRPALRGVPAARQARQIRRASRHLAALALPRVEDRVMALFCDLADRWGRAPPEGIRIDVPLTHAVIGQLVGARRPTVSLALTDLAAAGRLVRQDERCWLPTADVPLAGVSAS